jgi:enamine deaminase RidA (YjgF/YER057c/UK114 family)
MKKVISTSNAPAAIGPYSQAIQVGNKSIVIRWFRMEGPSLKG